MARETCESLCQKAQQAVAQGQNQEARQFYQQALGLRFDSPEAHYGMATVCFLTGDLATSAYHFKEVTRLDPGKAGAYINLGAVYNRLEQYEDAIAALRRGISLDHSRAEGYYNLGLVYRKLGQHDMAVQAYREATRINPRMADAHYNIANIYVDRGQFGLAVAHYKQALEIRPTWEKALRSLENAEQALQQQEGTEGDEHGPGPQVDVALGAGEQKQATLDPERLVDPQLHTEMLRNLHRASVDADELARNLLKTLIDTLEPAIKELSAVLLYPNNTATDIEGSIRKFEEAISAVKTGEDTLQNSVERVRVQGEQLLRS